MSVQTPDVSDVAGYAAAVRRALAWLSPEQIEDLTDGLEADLAEALADESTASRGLDPVTRFGSPEEYATELGAAAGLVPPPVGPAAGRFHLPHPVRAARLLLTGRLAQARRTRWWPPVEGFLVALRPVWWVLRGWVVWQVAHRMVAPWEQVWLPRGIGGFLAMAALVVVSVQWGRGAWRLPGRWRTVGLLLSAAAAVAAVPVLVSMAGDRTQHIYDSSPVAAATPDDGVWVGGMQVSNLFVYDAAGDPLSDVQIYDDRGRPVVTGVEGLGNWWLPGVDRPWSFVGVDDADGRTRWNVYPLRGGPSDTFDYCCDARGNPTLPDSASAQDPPRPFAKAPAIVVPSSSAASSPSPSPSAAPGEGGAAAPSEAATPDGETAPTPPVSPDAQPPSAPPASPGSAAGPTPPSSPPTS